MLNITPLICAQKTSSDHMIISPSPTGEHISQTCRQFYQHFWMLFGVLSNFCTLPANNEARDLFWILFQFLFVNLRLQRQAHTVWAIQYIHGQSSEEMGSCNERAFCYSN